MNPHGIFCECETCERMEREADEATKDSLLQARHREYASGLPVKDWDAVDTMAILAGTAPAVPASAIENDDSETVPVPAGPTIETLNLSTNALTSLLEVGLTDAEVAFDLGHLSRGDKTRDEILAICLDGAEGADRVAAWTEYVDAIVRAAEVGS